VTGGFIWVYLDAAGARVGRSERFPGREDAEEFMAHAWEELRERGVTQVELVDEDGGTAEYRMSLGGE
jgi:hypothetical protein